MQLVQLLFFLFVSPGNWIGGVALTQSALRSAALQ